MDLLDDVLAIDDQRAVPRHPQRDVQHGPVLRDVDVLAPEHRIAALGDAALLRQLNEQLQRFVGGPVLGVVEEESGAICDQTLAAIGVLGEQVAQVPLADLGVVLLECLPGLALPKLWLRRHGPEPNRAGPSAYFFFFLTTRTVALCG